jgi:Na+/H+ antiporter NhaA
MTAADASTTSPVRERLSLLRGFVRTEAGGAVFLLGAAVAAVLWSNSAWAESYFSLWATEISFTWGQYELGMDLAHWVNDGVMTLFFLVIGLEVRREFDMGEFRERRRIAPPLFAALGGMLLPIGIFLAINAGSEGSRGWAMVMATDTAFAVGVLALVGRRSSFRLRTFLLTLVIVDDVAATAVIAIVYSANLQMAWLGIAIGLLVVMAVLRAIGVQRFAVHASLGVGIWLATLESGVHPSIAGVAIGLLTSAYPPRRAVLERASRLARAFRQRPTPELASQAARGITLSLSPNERLQHALHPWSSYVVVPLFALVNAGLPLSLDLVGEAVGSPLVIGIILGLVVGKTLGIPIGAWVSTRRWFGGHSLAVGWPSLVAAASVAGIGFTMSLLIAELSYEDPLLDLAKVGIFMASIVAAALSFVLFHAIGLLPREWLHRADALTSRPVLDLTEDVDPTRDHVRGPEDALVTLVEYGDFECPHCGRVAPVVRELLERFDGQVRFVFRHLPLVDIHPNAAIAAEAAEAAGAQGRFWEMHDTLYEHQDDLDVHDLVRFAEAIGLHVDAFSEALRDGRFSGRVAQDVDSAEEAGVAGTPGFFVNGVRFRGPYDLDTFEARLRLALEMAELRAGAAAKASGAAEASEPGPAGG